MNGQQHKQLDRYSMMIVSKYFKNIGDFIKLILICKKFKEIPAMFHYNPVPLKNKIKLFPNIETYCIYDKKDILTKGYNKYLYWNEANYERYLNKKGNEEFKSILFSLNDWRKYKSFKGANVLIENSLSQFYSEEINLTGITKLRGCCFKGNSHVKQIKLDSRITTIPGECFENCSSLLELDLSYVKVLGNSCFGRCSSLTSLTLPEMLYKIGDNCFNGFNEIEKIESKGMKIIEANMNYSLYKSFKKNGIEVKGDILYNGYDVFKYGNEIPEEVSIINSCCFNGVTTLGDVILPKSVSQLERYCFSNCSIKSIDLSYVVKNESTFFNCNALTSITLNKNIIDTYPENNNYYQFYNYLTSLKNIELTDTNHIPIVSNHLSKLIIGKGYQYDKIIYTKQDRTKTNSIIPEEVNIIDYCVYCYENNIKTIIIPSNVSQICSNNFYFLTVLESIKIQSTNIQCDASCFNNLKKIKELDLRGITSFGPCCICDCPSLTKLVIQNVPIDNGLTNCDSLKEIEIIGIENNEYEYPINYKTAKLFENKGIHFKRKVFYKVEVNYNEESYCIPNGVNEIASYSFSYRRLKEITIPSSVTLIKTFSFINCLQLTHLIIEGNPKIEKKAFWGCYQLIENQPELKQYS